MLPIKLSLRSGSAHECLGAQGRSRTRDIVFVAGASRSGTSLMRRILNKSDRIAICKENHFLGHFVSSEGLRHKLQRFGSLEEDNNVLKLVNFLYSGGLDKTSKHRPVSAQWHWMLKRVDRENLLRRVLRSDRNDRALFRIMMEVYADWKGKPIMGEKTPAHILYVPTIIRWFPTARIIHMLRDPRAIFVSELRRRRAHAVSTPFRQMKHLYPLFKLLVLLQTTILWFKIVRCHSRYKSLYRKSYYLLRFEDLVTRPELTIRRVCDFLQVGFQTKMLEQRVVSRGFQSGQAGFDAHAAHRWKNHIDPWVDWWFRLWFGKYLKEFHYIS